MKAKEIQHLYWRAGFGITPKAMQSLLGKTKKEIVNQLFSDSQSFSSLELDISELRDEAEMSFMSKDKKKIQELIKKNRKKLKDFNLLWIDRLMNPKELLRERMTLFWANHFVVRDNRIDFVQDYNNMLREHALGNFRDFVKAMSKQAAMLKYLNNKQNRKQKPNENFARELMELFTLGKGHYTEQDIKESARAFTGYFHDIRGEFLMRKRQHDDLPKTFFGKTGNFDGDDIIDIILEQKQCAQFISEKIYKYFVNETINKTHVEAMTNEFCKDYDIENLMRYVFTSSWFYDEENIGTKIKSPIDFIVGMQNVVPMTFGKENALFAIQKSLGQTLLAPPNVAGWKGGKSWIDSNTIVLRLRYPSVFLNRTHIPVNRKGDFGDPMSRFIKRKGEKLNLFKVTADWNTFNDNFKSVMTEDLSETLLVPELSHETKAYLEKLSKSSKEDYCIQLLSIPEYQMC